MDMKTMKNISKNIPLSERAYSEIKEAIITNKLKSGDVLTEEQLAVQLSISRTPIRTALKQLVYEHLAEINANKNVVVSNVTLQDISNVSVVRCALEPLAIHEMGGKITKKELEKLKRIEIKARNAKSHEEFLKYEYEFHTQLAYCAKNTFLHDMIERINLVCNRYLMLSGTLDKYSVVALDEHETILRYIEEEDFAKAEEAMYIHVKNAGDRMLIL